MITFAGNNVLTGHDVVITKHLRLWAERGLIHIEDSRDNSYNVFSVRVILHRMRGISDMLGNSSDRQVHSESTLDRKWRQDQLNMLEGMTEVVRRAQRQGMPSDPTASRDLVRRRPKTVCVPGYGGGM